MQTENSDNAFVNDTAYLKLTKAVLILHNDTASLL